MIDEDIRALLDLKQYPKPTPEQKSKARGHMQQLRKAGFTNRDIFILSEGFWKENTIKQYLKGEKIVNTTERDKIMETIVNLIKSGLTFDDVNATISRKKTLDEKKITIEDEDRLIQVSRQGIDLGQLSNALREIGPNDILYVTRLYENLVKQGWDIKILNLVKEVTDKYGGVVEAFKAVLLMVSLKDLEERQTKALETHKNIYDEIIAKNQEINKINTDILAIKTYVDMSKILINEYSYDLTSIKTLMDFAKKYGPPWEALEAINKYNQLQELNDAVQKQKIEATKIRAEITAAKAELEEIQQTIEEAHHALGVAEEKLNREIITQGLHDILIDPEKTQLTRDEFLNIAYAVTDGLIKYTVSNPIILSDWQSSRGSLEYVRSQTTKLIGKG